MSKKKGHKGSRGGQLTLKSLLWRIWIIAALGWVTFGAITLMSDVVDMFVLDGQIAKYEEDVRRSVPGSNDWSTASYLIKDAIRERRAVRNGLIPQGIVILAPPVAVLFGAFIVALLIGKGPEEDNPAAAPASD